MCLENISSPHIRSSPWKLAINSGYKELKLKPSFGAFLLKNEFANYLNKKRAAINGYSTSAYTG